MRPTIRDVAQKAGVAVGTVSNVLNGRGRVSEATRQRVQEAVDALGYQPNVIAQSLISWRNELDRAATSDAARLSTVGYLSVDFIARVDVLPHRDDRITAERIVRAVGGPAANVAIAAASLGAPYTLATELITALGFDTDSDWALAELARRGIGTGGIERRQDHRLSRAFVLVEPNGSRTIINEPIDLAPADLERYLRHSEASRHGGTPHGLHVEGFQVPALIDALPQAREAGVTLSMHGVGLPQAWQTPEALGQLLHLFDAVFLNRESLEAVLGRSQPTDRLIAEAARLCQELADPAQRGLFVVTLDREGAVLVDGHAPFRVPAPDVAVVDRTGAGDALAGAFLAVWLNGAGPDQALRYGVLAASQVVTVPGAQAADLSRTTLDQLAGIGPPESHAAGRPDFPAGTE